LLGLLFAERILPIPPSDAALKADCTNFCRFWVWYEWETNVGIFGIAYCGDIILVLNFKIRTIREIIFLIKRTCHNTSGLSAIIAGLGWVEANDEDCTEDGDAYSDPESGNHKF